MGLATALGMRRDPAPARRALQAMTAEHHPTYVYLAPNVLPARAWVVAAEGGVSEAAAPARKAAEVAASQGQPAVEVLGLRTAAGFGDGTVADRLLPRPPAVCPTATSPSGWWCRSARSRITCTGPAPSSASPAARN